MLELHAITAGYDRKAPVVRNVTLSVAPGEGVGLLGPSGCGKSTLARVAALLHRPDAGTLLLDGDPVRRWRHRAPRAQRTAIGVVFQQPRLSADPRLRLTDLIAEPLRATGRRDEVRERVAELAPSVGLTPDLLDRRPHEVSDGQLQRACLARALLLRPRWLICDEMTAILDASTTAALVAAVEEYRSATGAGLLAVGHDQVLLGRWCDRTVSWEKLTSTEPGEQAEAFLTIKRVVAQDADPFTDLVQNSGAYRGTYASIIGPRCGLRWRGALLRRMPRTRGRVGAGAAKLLPCRKGWGVGLGGGGLGELGPIRWNGSRASMPCCRNQRSWTTRSPSPSASSPVATR